MSVEASPFAIQANNYSAEQTRRGAYGFQLLRGASIGSVTGGVVNLAGGDLQLTAPVSGLSVLVAAGECCVPGSSSAVQSGYILRNTGSLSVALAAASPSNPRIDLICASIADAAYTGSTNAGSIVAVTGTPTASASLANLLGAPSLPTSSLLLGYVLVPANASNIVTADILNDAVQLQGSLALGGAALGANVFTGAQTAPSFIASGSTGATAASNYGGATTSGAPASGTWTKGTYVVDQSGSIWICTTAGTPGTWAQVGSISAAAIESTFTATGQLYVGTGSGGGKLLPVGTAGYVLTSNGTGATGPSWSAPVLAYGASSTTNVAIAQSGTTKVMDTASLAVGKWLVTFMMSVTDSSTNAIGSTAILVDTATASITGAASVSQVGGQSGGRASVTLSAIAVVTGQGTLQLQTTGGGLAGGYTADVGYTAIQIG